MLRPRFAIILAIFLIMPFTVLAQSSQVVVDGTTLTLEGAPNVLYGADISGATLTITMKGGTYLTITAPDRRALLVSSGYTSAPVCNESYSSITLNPPASVDVIDIPVTLGSMSCDGTTPTPIATVTPSVSVTPLASVEPLSDQTARVFQRLADIIGVSSAANYLRQSPTANAINNTVAKPISILSAITGVVTLVVTTTTASATAALSLSQLLQFLSSFRFSFLGLIRLQKRRPWGRVVYKDKGTPAQGVTVQVYESRFKKLKDTQVTDQNGRFGALVIPGSYYIKLSKSGFETSQSEVVTISSYDQALNMELTITSAHDVSAHSLRTTMLWLKVRHLLDAINPYILAAGTLVSLLSALITPSRLNLGLLVLYIVLDVLKIYFAVHLIRPFGRVLDASQKPLGLSVVRIFENTKQILLATKVTDEEGRFSFLLAPGSYYVTCIKTGFGPYTSKPLTIGADSVVNFDINLTRSAT